MVKKITFIIILLFTVGTYLNAQTSGNDVFGYTWYSQDDPNGKPMQWVDISSTGTLVTGLGDDNFVGPFPIGFNFTYYWLNFNQFYVGSNGYISFGQGGNISSTSIGFPTQPTPGGALNNYIAALLSDLTFIDKNSNPIPGAEVRYQTIGDSCIISFINVPFWTDETPNHYRGSNSFQIILNRADSSITLNYLSSSGPVHTSYTQPGVNFMTRGMENVTGTVGFSLPGNEYPSNQCYFIDYPAQTTYSVKDIAAEWIHNSANGGIFAIKGTPFNVTAAVRNTGTSPIDTGTVMIVGSYINKNFSVQMRDTVYINAVANPIAAGETRIINFPKPITPSASGAFAYRIQIKALYSGEYAANNTMVTSVDVIDPNPAQQELILAYDDDNFDPNNGDGIITLDAGAYFEPPFYPCQVNAASFGLIPLVGANPSNQNGFIAKFYDKNFNLIETVTVQPNQVQINYSTGAPIYNRANLTTPYILTNPGDGIYVSFQLILVDSIRTPLLTDNSAHISRRMFETIGGIWAPYRSLDEEDFGIRLIVLNPFTSTQKAEYHSFSLGQSYPNPANQTAIIPFTLNTNQKVTLTIRDLMGRTIETKDLGYMPAGNHQVQISTQELSNGIYTYTLSTGEESATLKMVVNH